jgi:electron transfer flavoprotein alpha subunit
MAGAEVDLPAVLSVAERLTYPAKRSPEERAAVGADKIRTLGAAALGEGPWGEKGSPTSVGETRLLESPRLGHRFFGTVGEQVAGLVAALEERGAFGGRHAHAGVSALPMTQGSPAVLVTVEPGAARITRELLGGASQVAAALGGSVVAAGPGDLDEGLGAYGADEVVALYGAAGPATPDEAARALAEIALERGVSVLLGPSTSWGREVCGRVAARLGAGLTGDASALEIHDGRLLAWKPAFGGSLEAAISCSTALQCATVRAGALPLPEARAHVATLLRRECSGGVRVRYVDERRDDEAEVLPTAEYLVGVGVGVEPERYDAVQPLLELLGAELVATRKVTDRGWLPRTRQVGITGVHLHPRLSIGLGLSGSAYHLIGLGQAGTIVVVNSDPDAVGFEFADYGVVADWQEFVPAFVAAARPVIAQIGAY